MAGRAVEQLGTLVGQHSAVALVVAQDVWVTGIPIARSRILNRIVLGRSVSDLFAVNGCGDQSPRVSLSGLRNLLRSVARPLKAKLPLAYTSTCSCTWLKRCVRSLPVSLVRHTRLPSRRPGNTSSINNSSRERFSSLMLTRITPSAVSSTRAKLRRWYKNSSHWQCRQRSLAPTKLSL